MSALVHSKSHSRAFSRVLGGEHHHGRILLVEDDPDQAAILEAVLRHEGLDVVVAASGEQAIELHHRAPADVLVTDLNLPGMSGLEVIRRLAPFVENEAMVEPRHPVPAVIVVTGAGSVASAVEALKLGAADYLQKPLDPARLVSLVRELLASDNVREADADEELENGPLVFEGMIGGSKRMRDLFARIERVAATMAPVLIVGESGTGKELVARAIHKLSSHAHGPFVPVHTGAIPRELIGSELFGHEKGSFTGAFAAAEGKFETAAGGTVFLDEVGTMDAAVQVSLLRVLETYRFTRVGGRKEIDAEVRVVAATNKDLLDLVDENVFREDLYYRLNVFTVTLPPLRDRQEDVLPIAERFLVKYAKRYGSPARHLSEAAWARLLDHDWPGNVRELRNVMEQTALFAPREVVEVADLQIGGGRIERRVPRRSDAVHVSAILADAEPVELAVPRPEPLPPLPPPSVPPCLMFTPLPSPPAPEVEGPDHPLVLRLPIGTRLAEAEKQLILLTLDAVRGNKQRAARILGISRRGLYSKLQAYSEQLLPDPAGPESPDNADEAIADDALDEPQFERFDA